MDNIQFDDKARLRAQSALRKHEYDVISGNSRHANHVRVNMHTLSENDIQLQLNAALDNSIRLQPCDISLSGAYGTYVCAFHKQFQDIPAGSGFYFVNAYKPLITKKLYTPAKLGLAGFMHSVLSADSFVEKAENALQIAIHDNDIEIYKLMSHALRCVAKIESEYNHALMHSLGDGVLQMIGNDFGEILSTLWYALEHNGTHIQFPKASNSALTDSRVYFSDNEFIDLSIKNGKGSDPSLSAYKNEMLALRTQLPKDLQHILDVLICLVNEPVAQGVINLSDRLQKMGFNMSLYSVLQKKHDKSNLLTVDFTNKLLSIKSFDRMYDYVELFWAHYKRNIRLLRSSMKKMYQQQPDKLYGCFTYLLAADAVKAMNAEPEFLIVLKAIVNKKEFVQVHQCLKKFKYIVAIPEQCDAIFHEGNLSVTYPDNSRIGPHLIYK